MTKRKPKATPTIAINPALIFVYASGYWQIVRLANEYWQNRPDKNPFHMFVPSAAIAAFASELFLKCLWCLEGKTSPRGHNLKDLYLGLAADIKDQIKDRWEARIKTNPNVQESWLRFRRRPTFDDYLRWNSKAFAELRYIHEGDPKGERPRLMGFPDLNDILRELILEKKPEWASL